MYVWSVVMRFWLVTSAQVAGVLVGRVHCGQINALAFTQGAGLTREAGLRKPNIRFWFYPIRQVGNCEAEFWFRIEPGALIIVWRWTNIVANVIELDLRMM